MGALVDEVRALHDDVLAGGGAQYVERHRARGKMMVRERLEALVDPGTPVLELSPLAGLHTGDPVGGGVVVALAEVAHTQCLVIANDPTVRGGTTSPTTIRKLLRAMDVAEENRLPLLLLVESGGADLPAPGRRLRARRRAVPPPDPAVGAGHPDHLRRVRLVHRRRRLPPGHERLHGHGRGPGPRLPRRAAAGEDGDRRGRRRGGARRRRACTPGPRACATTWPGTSPRPSAWPAASSAHLHWPRLGPGPVDPADEPLYPAEELLGIASVDVRVPFDVREILARVVDGSRFEEFKALYGAQLVCGWASIGGYPIGVLANNGILFSPEAQKGAQFIALVQPQRHADPVRAEHHRLHGGHALRAGRDHQGRRQADQRRVQLDGAPPDAHGRRQLRRRQLRHGGPGLRPALRLHLAEPPHRRDGPEAAGRRPLHRAAQRGRRGRPPLRRGGRRGAAPGHREPDRGGVDGAVRHRAAVGRRDHRPAATRARCWPSP